MAGSRLLISLDLEAYGIERTDCVASSCLSFSFKWRTERPERGGPCWLLKPMQMGTFGVQMKGVFPWLARWSRLAGARDFYPALAAYLLVCFSGGELKATLMPPPPPRRPLWELAYTFVICYSSSVGHNFKFEYTKKIKALLSQIQAQTPQGEGMGHTSIPGYAFLARHTNDGWLCTFII